MGQQQLLLVILVTILVGIATVVAINVFGTAAEDANRDAVRQDLLQGATAAQGVWAKPRMLDGAGQDFTTVDADLIERLGMPITEGHNSCAAATDFGNENGCYTVGDILADSFTITGVPTSGGASIVATITRDDATRQWSVEMADVT
ncbi:MAG: hypothetical protein WD266_04700 [Balneolales bacterium]